MKSDMAGDEATILAERTLELVRIASPSGEEAEACAFVHEFLENRTQPSYLVRHGDSVIATYGASPKDEAWSKAKHRIALGGHLDTVPFAGHPEPQIDGAQVIGLGTTDMKGALAVMMRLAEAPPASEAAPLALVFYDNEEVDFEINGLRKLFDLEPWLTSLDLALMMEPTDNVLELGCLGSMHAEVTFHGVAAHSARPWMGDNAIHKAGALLERLSKTPYREVQDGPVVFREVLNATIARGGQKRTVIPDSFMLNLNLRFTPDRDLDSAEAHLRSFLPDGVSVKIIDRAPSAPARMDSPLLAALKDDLGLEARAKQAWTDVAQFSGHGVPAANFGPGIPSLAHKTDELIPIENLVRSYEILRAFLERQS